MEISKKITNNLLILEFCDDFDIIYRGMWENICDDFEIICKGMRENSILYLRILSIMTEYTKG